MDEIYVVIDVETGFMACAYESLKKAEDACRLLNCYSAVYTVEWVSFIEGE